MATTQSDGKTVTEAPTDDKRVLDLDEAEPGSVPGATVIFAPAYARTDDGAALRYDGDVPIAAVGVYSERDTRAALEEHYDGANIDRAFRVGTWITREKPARATAAISHAERDVAADGGTQATLDTTNEADAPRAPNMTCENDECGRRYNYADEGPECLDCGAWGEQDPEPEGVEL